MQGVSKFSTKVLMVYLSVQNQYFDFYKHVSTNALLPIYRALSFQDFFVMTLQVLEIFGLNLKL